MIKGFTHSKSSLAVIYFSSQDKEIFKGTSVPNPKCKLHTMCISSYKRKTRTAVTFEDAILKVRSQEKKYSILEILFRHTMRIPPSCNLFLL